MYVLIEMADVELIGVQVFTDRRVADGWFDRAADAQGAHEWADEDLGRESAGTLRLAGDDSYSAQLVAVVPQ